ncbi:T9SS type A sorting domain-containing protein [Chryseobacterium sp.]|uniref:T9SS type A sorting domain-containing protein n=1 Tax=Chryseobacterium sp. TaxID=1871047 RepID=UPI001AFEEB1B|nr:T9SS type A sorting domain-containing protein [Chryseobacterium sp.]MBO9692942.1 T9SS type A sorting domain-containing protein [Chryseobacterium sp.]
MKNKLLPLIFIFSISKIYSQAYQTIATSGFNSDVIANGTGPATASTNNSVDSPSDNFAFISKDFKVNTSDTSLTYGLPENGLIVSDSPYTSGLSFQLAPYSDNNSLRLSNNETGTLTFLTPYNAENIYILGTSGSGASTADVKVNFQDGTSQTFISVNFNDWYGGLDFAIKGIGRVNRQSNTLESTYGQNPRIYQIPLTISNVNQSKIINSLTFTKSSSNGFLNIFAISIKPSNILSLSEVKMNNVAKIFPNPFSNQLNVINASEIDTISISDLSGRMVKHHLKPEPKMDFSDLTKGSYIFIIKNKNGSISHHKVIKK